MNKSVTSLQEKASAIIDRFLDDHLAGKLLAMGVLPGSQLKVVRIAPRGGGYYLKIDGQNIAVRVIEAQNILLK